MNSSVAIDHGPSAVEQTTADMCRDAIADHLHLAAVQIACARMYVDINDDAGMHYALAAGRVHYRAALETAAMLKAIRREGDVSTSPTGGVA